MRHASTRSLEVPRQPTAGFAQSSVGSIAELGIRYGANATKAKTTARPKKTAKAITSRRRTPRFTC